MTFNSFEYFIFLPVVFVLYWFVFNKSGKSQNILLVLASVFFYCWADWRFLALVIVNALFNYYMGISIAGAKKEKTQKHLLWAGVAFNIAILGYFKYFNFFYDSFVDMLNFFGSHANPSSLKLLLPLGISFFTFQTLGYLIDIYNYNIKPSRNLLAFSAYVIYFPKIIAGPIERAQKFLPQIERKRTFDQNMAIDGLRQMLWGLFAKIVLADNLFPVVHGIFSNSGSETGSTLFMGLILSTIQVYFDFAGYSNIAIGTSKLFGMRLMKNFDTPFFSTNISDFWNRWHISLSSWMLDYLFTPLSFVLRKRKKKGLILSIMITFVVVGFWHGANWTFIVFGILNGIYYIPLILKGKVIKSSLGGSTKIFPSATEFVQMLGLFLLLSVTIIFFWVNNIAEAFTYLSHVFSPSFFVFPDLKRVVYIIPAIIIFFVIEWMTRDKDHPLQFSGQPVYLRWGSYLIIGFVVLLAFEKDPNAFIYLQF